MDRYFYQLPETIKTHVREVTRTSGLPYTEESFEKIAKSWLEKKKMFEEQTKSLHMVEVETLDRDDKRGALMLTFSGSLVSVGTLVENRRWAEYASIGLRKDVPDIAKKRATELLKGIRINESMEFIGGPIKRSSPLLKIAVCKEDVSAQEQEKRIREATIFLTNGFVEINRTIISLFKNLPYSFTMKSITSYIAEKNSITKKSAKKIIEDFITVIEAGVLTGERVPVGKLGKIFLKTRSARKARIGRNPQTGVELTIKAQPETLAPKISFSKSFKEKAKNTKLEL